MKSDKRYQVFVSSTFADLKEERQTVIQTLLEAGCMPAGMELFPAAGELWDLIKGVIDDSDYYIVIIAGRYGSVTVEGISYTEKEFDHAVQSGKEVLAFLHKNPADIIVGKSELDEPARSKLSSFRKKLETGRSCKYWANTDDLAGKVSTSINHAITRHPAEGWIKGRFAADNATITEMANTRAENDRLRRFAESAAALSSRNKEALAGLPDEFVLAGEIGIGREKILLEWSIKTVWGIIFEMLGSLLLMPIDDLKLNEGLTRLAKSRFLQYIISTHNLSRDVDIVTFNINENDLNQIKIQFLALDLTSRIHKRNNDGTTNLLWTLTPEGEKTLIMDRALKKGEILRR